LVTHVVQAPLSFKAAARASSEFSSGRTEAETRALSVARKMNVRVNNIMSV
jgi:hypothetical protein